MSTSELSPSVTKPACEQASPQSPAPAHPLVAGPAVGSPSVSKVAPLRHSDSSGFSVHKAQSNATGAGESAADSGDALARDDSVLGGNSASDQDCADSTDQHDNSVTKPSAASTNAELWAVPGVTGLQRERQLAAVPPDVATDLHDLAELVDRITAHTQGMDSLTCQRVAQQLIKHVRRLNAVHQRIVGDAVAGDTWPADSQYRSATTWLHHTHLLSGAAARGIQADEIWLRNNPVFAELFANGQISAQHVSVARRHVTKHPWRQQAFTEFTDQFSEVAVRVDPTLFGRILSSWGQQVDDLVLSDPELSVDDRMQLQHSARQATLYQVGDMWELNATLPDIEGGLLAGVLNQIMEEDRRRSCTCFRAHCTCATDGRTLNQRRADALIALVQHVRATNQVRTPGNSAAGSYVSGTCDAGTATGATSGTDSDPDPQVSTDSGSDPGITAESVAQVSCSDVNMNDHAAASCDALAPVAIGVARAGATLVASTTAAASRSSDHGAPDNCLTGEPTAETKPVSRVLVEAPANGDHPAPSGPPEWPELSDICEPTAPPVPTEPTTPRLSAEPDTPTVHADENASTDAGLTALDDRAATDRLRNIRSPSESRASDCEHDVGNQGFVNGDSEGLGTCERDSADDDCADENSFPGHDQDWNRSWDESDSDDSPQDAAESTQVLSNVDRTKVLLMIRLEDLQPTAAASDSRWDFTGLTTAEISARLRSASFAMGK